MKRPAGVTVSAILGILGSIGFGILGVLTIIGAITMGSLGDLPQPEGVRPPPVPLVVILAVEAAIFFALAVVGIICSIGLFRLRNWARISFMIFAGILVFFALSGAVGGLLMMFTIPAMVPPDTNIPPGFFTGVFVVFIIAGLAFAALGGWWLYYFSRRGMRVRFMGEAAAAVPRRGPLSVTVIAWIMVVSGTLLLPGALASSYPSLMFGFVFDGSTGRLILLAFGAYALVTGIGILKWRPWGHTMALAFYGFGIVNGILCLLPGAMERMREAMNAILPPNPALDSTVFLSIGLIFGLAVSAVLFVLLLSRRRAFLAACSPS
jgi:hypothetical protein